jgi:predicted alpha/beta superfamily hydrolase
MLHQRRLSILTAERVLMVAAILTVAWTTVRAQEPRQLTEDTRYHKAFHSKFLAKDRDVIVWLPPGYQKDTTKRYPVLYMHDGINVFAVWRMDETALALISNKQIEPLILVLVGHAGTAEDRFSVYTPSKDPRVNQSGQADQYGRMLVEELKPFIDAEYRTLTDASNTGLGGASLGGLVTLYLGLKHPNIFGRLAVLSPSFWWDRGMIFREVKSLSSKPASRIWLDIGTREGPTDAVKQMRDLLKTKGWVLDSDLVYFEAKDAGHEDLAFASRAPKFLKFLFPFSPAAK